MSAAENTALLHEGEPGARAGPVPPAASAMPAYFTPLVGREREVAEALDRLADARLLTLTGPGGTGKTRLALALAERAGPAFADGVVFVDLSLVVDPPLVAATIARQLDLREQPGRSLAETLIAALAPKQLLLILDNLEQVVEAASWLHALLGACPGLTVLATSRIPLRLSVEREYAVPPLSLPAAAETVGPAALATVPAVALFVERARAVRADFTLTAENAGAVAAICTRLDGLPLALELAAARLRLFGPTALLARLDDRLALLTGGSRDLPARQRTLRDTIAWSDELLAPEERRLFRRLAIFAGGCTLDAAETVCGGAELGVALLDGLATLVDHSLVRREGDDGEPRFVMLETIRAFALEGLATSGEAEAIAARHATHYAALAEDAGRALMSAHRAAAIAHLDREHGNIRVALDWATRPAPGASGQEPDAAALEHAESRERSALALRLVGALWVWFRRGWLGEGRRWATAALALSDGAPVTAARARALFVAGQLALAQGDKREAVPLLRESVRGWRMLGDPGERALAVSYLALAETPEEGLASAEESLAIAQRAGDGRGEAWALTVLGEIRQRRGETAAAREALERSVAMYGRLGDAWLRSVPLAALGRMALDAGEYAGARATLQESLTSFRASGDRLLAARALTDLGLVAALEGDTVDASTLLAAAYAEAADCGDVAGGVRAARMLAALLHRDGQPALGRRLLGIAGEGDDATPSGLGTENLHPQIAGALAELRREDGAPAANDGDAPSLPALVAAAAAALRGDRDETAPARSADTPATDAPPASRITHHASLPAGLSGREVEVLRLLAEGKRDAAIAAALVISPHTVHRHVNHIFAKTGATNRVEAAAWARRQGLAP